MVWAFIEEFSSRMGKKITQVPRKTMEMLQRHPWPGNVRELRNVIEHSTIITTDETLRVPMLEQATSGSNAISDSGRFRARAHHEGARENQLAHQGTQRRRYVVGA